MTAYRQTFRRHRRLFLMPVVLTFVLGLWFVLGSPKAYESTANLWVDNPPPADSSLTNADPTIRPPAEQEQLLINELLKTRDFRVAVGHRGPLAAYLAANPGQGWGPQALLSGGGSLDHRILSALSAKNVVLTVSGPQVLSFSYRGATPAVARGTLNALLAQLSAERLNLSKQRGAGALAYYRSQVSAASKAVTEADARISAYIANHPASGKSDPSFAALDRAKKAAASQLANATANANRAASPLNAPGGAGSALTVIDHPTAPTGPMSGHKKQVLALIGALFAGMLISFLGVVALTPSRPDGFETAWHPRLPPLPPDEPEQIEEHEEEHQEAGLLLTSGATVRPAGTNGGGGPNVRPSGTNGSGRPRPAPHSGGSSGEWP